LEQLRYLEFGKRIKMVETTHVGIGIDTPEDLEKREKCCNTLDFRDRNSLWFYFGGKEIQEKHNEKQNSKACVVTRNFRLW
jgi:hypothetical protein